MSLEYPALADEFFTTVLPGELSFSLGFQFNRLLLELCLVYRKIEMWVQEFPYIPPLLPNTPLVLLEFHLLLLS